MPRGSRAASAAGVPGRVAVAAACASAAARPPRRPAARRHPRAQATLPRNSRTPRREPPMLKGLRPSTRPRSLRPRSECTDRPRSDNRRPSRGFAPLHSAAHEDGPLRLHRKHLPVPDGGGDRPPSRGERPDSDPVGPEDLSATIFHRLGINGNDEFHTPEGRPVKIVNDGRVLRELL